MLQQLPIRVPSCLTTVAFALLVGALASAPLVTVKAQRGKTPTPPDATASLVFAEGAGFAMVSDQPIPYAGAIIFGGSGDLRLDLSTGERKIGVTLGAPFLTSEDPSVTPPPSATYWTNAALYVRDIRSIPKGATARRVGRIGFGSSLPDHALGFRHTTAQGIVIYGTEACVRRLNDAEAGAPGEPSSRPTWRITSSGGCDGEGDEDDKAGVFQENIKGKINHKWKASYVVPFSITVTCDTNCTM